MRIGETRRDPPASARTRRGRAGGGDPDRSAGGLFGLQHAAGNRAVADLVAGIQRQVATPAVQPVTQRPLDSRALARALRFYAASPADYTPQIISQIQGAVGVPVSGTIDEDTVQAIARWQAENSGQGPALHVDGMAGPRTLPRMFRHGLNVAGEGSRFGQAAQVEVVDRWGSLSVEQRTSRLAELVNERLIAAGVPAVAVHAQDTGVAAGEFDFPSWTMHVGRRALAHESRTREQAADIVGTFYHEARHAEQWFRMAQYLAGTGRSAGAIAVRMDIPAPAAQAAAAAPLPRGSMQALIAKGWFESFYGGSDHEQATIDAVERAAALRDAAWKRYEQHPSAANKQAADAAEALFHNSPQYRAYQHLATENDAFATDPEAGAAISSGTTLGPISGPDPEDAPSPDTLLAQLRELLPGADEGTVA